LLVGTDPRAAAISERDLAIYPPTTSS